MEKKAIIRMGYDYKIEDVENFEDSHTGFYNDKLVISDHYFGFKEIDVDEITSIQILTITTTSVRVDTIYSNVEIDCYTCRFRYETSPCNSCSYKELWEDNRYVEEDEE